MKKLMRALGVALVGAVVCATPTFAQELRVGQSRNFALGDDMTSSMSAVVGQRVGHDVMATGGTMRRVSASRYLFCGMYLDQLKPNAVLGFVVIHDRSMNKVAGVAPVMPKEQEKLGCWPGERERLDASLRAIARMGKASKAQGTGPGMTSSTTMEGSQ